MQPSGPMLKHCEDNPAPYFVGSTIGDRRSDSAFTVSERESCVNGASIWWVPLRNQGMG
jgi:hypothetical protein